MNSDFSRMVADEAALGAAISKLAERLDRVYKGRNPAVLCVLKGAAYFCCDFTRAMKERCEIYFIRAKSYGSSAVAGELEIEGALPDFKGRDVIIADDIIDTGATLQKLKNMVLENGAASALVVALFDKPSHRRAQIEADISLFAIEDEFIVGYGLDYAEKYRNLPYVAVLKREIYEKQETLI